MRALHIIIGAAFIAAFAIGCSKSSSQQPQVSTPTSLAEMAAFTTNSLDVLQARYKEDEKQIEAAQTNLAVLRRKYGITDTSPTQLDQTNQNGETVVTSQQPYWDAKRKLARVIDFQKLLISKIEADKIDQQIKAQAGSH